jgi:DNA topoisomerase I
MRAPTGLHERKAQVGDARHMIAGNGKSRAAAQSESRPPELVRSAKSAGLVYVRDRGPGIKRRRNGRGFRYVNHRGHEIRARVDLDRIKRLAIPPAWRHVWICPNASGHLQATGRDARGRKQYRYHPNWREVRDQVKYDQILAFAAALPALRRRLGRDLAAPGLSKRKVVAAVVQLLEKTFIRVGNDEYARQNQSFGLTTMRNGHVRVSRSTLRFRFRGKSGKTHDISFDDRRLALLVRRCQELPGHELFEYLDEDGNVHDIGSADVNDYLREATGQDFTAKSFRTWAGTLLVAHALQELPPFQSSTQAKRNIVKAVEAVAGLLGNTPAVCRKCYLHPAIIEAYIDRTLLRTLGRGALKPRSLSSPARDLNRTEVMILALLRRRLHQDERRTA